MSDPAGLHLCGLEQPTTQVSLGEALPHGAFAPLPSAEARERSERAEAHHSATHHSVAVSPEVDGRGGVGGDEYQRDDEHSYTRG